MLRVRPRSPVKLVCPHVSVLDIFIFEFLEANRKYGRAGYFIIAFLRISTSVGHAVTGNSTTLDTSVASCLTERNGHWEWVGEPIVRCRVLLGADGAYNQCNKLNGDFYTSI